MSLFTFREVQGWTINKSTAKTNGHSVEKFLSFAILSHTKSVCSYKFECVLFGCTALGCYSIFLSLISNFLFQTRELIHSLVCVWSTSAASFCVEQYGIEYAEGIIQQVFFSFFIESIFLIEFLVSFVFFVFVLIFSALSADYILFFYSLHHVCLWMRGSLTQEARSTAQQTRCVELLIFVHRLYFLILSVSVFILIRDSRRWKKSNETKY